MKTRRSYKRIISIISVLMLILTTVAVQPVVLSAWNGSIATSFAGGSGTSASPYLISTPEQLAYLAQLVNSNNTNYNDKYYSLTADIDLGGREWTPIGKGVATTAPDNSKSYAFNGQINGNGHTVSNFKITQASTSYIGLFGNANGGNNGKIENLYVSDFTINITSSGAYNLVVGGLAGTSYNKIISCGVSNGTINVTTTNSSNATVYVGGLLGRNQGGAVQKSFARVNVASTTSGTSCHSYAGGFVGYNSFGNILYSYATNDATSTTNGTTSAAYAGGFAAGNDANITSAYANGYASSVSKQSTAIAAGFIGYNNQNDQGTSTVTTSYATGNATTNSVTKTGYGGGFIGNLNAGTVTNCFATGNVNVTGVSNAYAGGFAGLSKSTISSCYRSSTQSITGRTVGSYGTSSSVSNFSSKTFFTSTSNFPTVWDFNTIWNIGVSGGYTYPTLIAVAHPVILDVFSGGNGTAAAPYEISTADELTYLANSVNSGVTFGNTYFKLTSNIDLDKRSWTPIGTGSITTTTATGTKAFCGHFDGGNYTISNFTITYAPGAYTGLFGAIYGGSVKNLNVTDFIINVTAPSGSLGAAGGIAGVSTGTISDCYAKGSITGIAKSTTSYVGGLVGRTEAGLVTGCIADVNVISSTTAASCHAIAGGLVGHNLTATISESYSTGNVESYSSGNQSAAYAGGLIGQNSSDAAVSNCYSTSSALATSANSTAIAGGLIGHTLGSVSTSYSTGNVNSTSSTKSAYGGGFAGNASGVIKNCFTVSNVTVSGETNNYVGQFAGSCSAALTNCYYTSAQSVSPTPEKAYGKSTTSSNLTKQVFYTSSNNFSPIWDFTNTWQIGKAADYNYPTLINTYIEEMPSGPEQDDDPYIDPEGWDGTAATSFEGGNGTENDPYQIANAAQLLLLANKVNKGDSDYTGRYYILTDNIDLNSRSWTPIGKDSNNYVFSGDFNGDGYVIENMKVKKSTNGYTGLFGYVKGGNIANVIINNAKFTITHNSSTNLYIGGVAAYSTGVIENCFVSGEFDINNSASNSYCYTGGIVGNNTGDVTGCVNEASITVSSTADTVSTGGITGSSEGSINRCSSNADINASGSEQVLAGGITGQMTKDKISMNCYSRGTISAECTNGEALAGGIAGSNIAAWTTSYSSADINAKSTTADCGAGGLFGKNSSMLTSCFSTGDITATATSADGNAGSLIGIYVSGALNNCYRSTEQELDGSKVNTRGSSTTLTNLRSEAYLSSTTHFIVPFDFDTVWQFKPVTGYEFPVHKGAVSATGASLDVWEGQVAEGFDGGSGTKARPYKIANAAQLAHLAYAVNTGTDYSNTYFELTADIDLSESTWVPIGKSVNITDAPKADKAFNGVFDGCGYTIKNITINNTDKSCYGLFGCVYNGTITNLNVENVTIDITAPKSANVYAGGIAGISYGSEISFLKSTGSVKVTSSGAGDVYAGGIVGGNYSSIIDISFSVADVNATNTGSGSYCISGGIAGYTSDSEINDCYYAGREVKAITMGNVEAYAGGITGYLTNNSSITIGYSTGDVAASSYIADSFAGGIAGFADSSAIESMLSIGDVTASSESRDEYGGGITGTGGTDTKCYKNKFQTITADMLNSSGTAVDPSNFTTSSFLINPSRFTTIWDFDDIWTIGETEDYEYPTLQDVPHIGHSGTDTPGGDIPKDIEVTYDDGAITINSETAINNAVIIISAYNGNTLTSTEFLPESIPQGESMTFTNTFSTEGANKIKIMIWESLQTQSQITPATEIAL